MPNVEGIEPGNVLHKWTDILTFIGVGIASVSVAIGLTHGDEHTPTSHSEKIYELMKVYFYVLFGWALLFSIQWYVQRLAGGGEAGMVAESGRRPTGAAS